jgi:hypothetical protein
MFAEKLTGTNHGNTQKEKLQESRKKESHYKEGGCEEKGRRQEDRKAQREEALTPRRDQHRARAAIVKRTGIEGGYVVASFEYPSSASQWWETSNPIRQTHRLVLARAEHLIGWAHCQTEAVWNVQRIWNIQQRVVEWTGREGTE